MGTCLEDTRIHPGMKTLVDSAGFRQFLSSRNLSEEQLAQHVALAERLESFSASSRLPQSLQEARYFVGCLLETATNTEANFYAMARYGRFIKNNAIYTAVLEVLDGAEAIEGLYNRLTEVVGAEKRDQIFESIDLPPLGLSNVFRARLNYILIERMQQLLDPPTCRKILAPSLRTLPEENYLPEREKYRQAGSFDAYLEMKRSEFIAQLEQIMNSGALFFNQEITPEVIELVRSNPEISQGVREGNILYVTKIPYLAKDWLVEKDPQQKRYLYCHCPWARESLRQGERRVSATFCQCSAGFHKRAWEVIFERTLEADVLQSVLQGDDVCRFAIHLPVEEIEQDQSLLE